MLICLCYQKKKEEEEERQYVINNATHFVFLSSPLNLQNSNNGESSLPIIFLFLILCFRFKLNSFVPYSKKWKIEWVSDSFLRTRRSWTITSGSKTSVVRTLTMSIKPLEQSTSVASILGSYLVSRLKRCLISTELLYRILH